MENEKIIDLNEGNIKFKARQYFGQPNISHPNLSIPRLWDVFISMKIAKTESPKLVLTWKRISEKLKQEANLIEEAIKSVKEPYLIQDEKGQRLPAPGTAEFFELDGKINEILDSDIALPYQKIKFSQITGIESVGELNAVEGIVDIEESL